MEKNCRNCKWFNGGKCTNLESQINIEGSGGIQYVEGGYFAEAVSEVVDYNTIIEAVLRELVESKKIIKKAYSEDLSKLFKVINKDSIIEAIEEELNDSLGSSVMNMGNRFQNNSVIEIQNPSEFYCSDWE
ncbi:MAG: hypothetical protein ACRCX8_06545 [Sarcina sp.]